MLHAWLAVPKISDIKVTLLKNPFKKEETE